MENEAKANIRWNEIEIWINRASAMGLEDVADVLFCERADVLGDTAAFEALIARTRAACLLHVFLLGADDDE